MMSRARVVRSGLVWAGSLGLAGCAGGWAELDAPRGPAMPTVTRPASAPRVAVNDADVVAAALRQAQAGDLATARRTLEAVPDQEQRRRIGTAAVAELARRDARQAVDLATGLSDGAGQAGSVALAAEALAQRDPEEALRWSLRLDDPAVAVVARRMVAQTLVQASPREALERIAAAPGGPGRDELLGFAVAAWARTEAEAAVGWVQARPDDALKPRLISAAGFEIAQHHPDRAIALAETLPASRNRWLLTSAIAETWVATDPKAALAWAGRLPAGEARAAAFAGLDTGLGVPTARRAAGTPGTRTVRSRGFGGGVAEAALGAGGSADFTAWLATQPPGRSRDEEIVEFVQQRGATDSGAIGQWLATLPPGATRDRAVEIYLEGQLIGSPHRAADWLRALPRSDRSDELVEKTARRWLQTNPDAAAAWLLETPLPPDRKERLLREAGR